MRGRTPEAVDAYLNMGLTEQGERLWQGDNTVNSISFPTDRIAGVEPAGPNR